MMMFRFPSPAFASLVHVYVNGACLEDSSAAIWDGRRQSQWQNTGPFLEIASKMSGRSSVAGLHFLCPWQLFLHSPFCYTGPAHNLVTTTTKQKYFLAESVFSSDPFMAVPWVMAEKVLQKEVMPLLVLAHWHKNSPIWSICYCS